jgi:hypothetical protein
MGNRKIRMLGAGGEGYKPRDMASEAGGEYGGVPSGGFSAKPTYDPARSLPHISSKAKDLTASPA